MSGNTLAGADRQKTVTFKADEDAVARFDESLNQLGYDNRSEALREFVEEQAPDDGRREYLPGSSEMRQKYEAMLDVANKDLIVAPRICGSNLAQKLGVGQDDLSAALADLRRAGYVSRQSAAPGTQRSGRGTVFRVKPRGADPDEWVYREDLE